MKVAIFSSTINPTDGYGTITNELCHKFHEKNVDFVLFLPKTAESSSDKFRFPIKYCLPPYIYRVWTPDFLGYFPNINLMGFSLVHSLFDFPYCFLAAKSAKAARLPFIMGAQGTYGVLPLTFWPEKHLLKWSYGRAKEIIVPSKFTAAKIREYGGDGHWPISVVHNGVDFERFVREVDIGKLKEKYKNKRILLTVGGLKSRKGQDLVIKALPAIINSHPDVKYLIVGTGHWRKYLEDLTAEMKLGDYVEFVGRVAIEKLIQYYHLCDIYVHTPRVDNLSFEGFGIVYLEAGACGKPIVATDAGGIRDAVIHDETGLIAKNEDSGQIAEYISRLLSNPAEAARLGKNGLKYAEQHDWSIIAERFIEKYKRYAV